MIWYMYILWNDYAISLVNIHHHTVRHFFLWWELKISLSNFQIHNTVLSTVVTMLYIAFPGLIYLISWEVWTFWPPLPILLTPVNHQSVFWGYFLLIFLDSTYEIIQYLSFSEFHLHNTFNVHPCCHKWQDFVFYGESHTHTHMHTHLPCTTVSYTFICQWMLRLFPYLGYCK